MKKNNVFLFAILLMPLSTFAQTTIFGKVIDANNQSQPYLSILLLNSTDSAYVNGALTDGDGKFNIVEKKSGDYILTIKSMGHIPYYKNIALKNSDIDLGNIALTADTKVLKEVSVVGTKKLIEFSGDKMIMDLSVSPVTSGLNAFDLLAKVPGVSVNTQSETIQIAGKTGVLIMIDGRPTNLSGIELAAMLKSMKSDEFEKVEVITNPSAKYEAQGTSGIINLKTKSGKVYGTSYILSLGGGYSYYDKFGSYPKYNEGFSVNVKRKKVTAYLNLNHRRGTDFVWLEESKSFLDSNQFIFEKQHSAELDKGQNHYLSARLNLDFYVFKNTTFGTSIASSLFDGNKKASLEQEINTGEDVNKYKINTDKRRWDNLVFTSMNAHLKHVFDTAGTELLVDVDLIFNHLDRGRTFYQHVFSTTTNQESVNTVSSLADPRTYVLTVSFEKQLAKTKLEVGYKSRVTFMNTNFLSDFVGIDSLQHSTFHFIENVNAAYILAKRALSSTIELEAGLRGEHTYTLGTNEKRTKISEQNYINLFPSFSLNKKFNSFAMSVGYSRRIARVDAANFNTFKRFENPLIYSQGNPNLIATLNNSYNVSATFKDKYYVELAYISRKNEIVEFYETDTIFIPGRNLTRSGVGNVTGRVGWWLLKGYIPITVNKIWMINLQLSGGLNDYDYTLNKAKTETQQVFWGGSCQQNFSITETFSAEINAYVNSGETFGFQTNKVMGAVDFGISKKILKKNGVLKLSLQDPFNLNVYRVNFNYDYLAGTGYYKWDNRSILLNFTYNFGNSNVNVMPWRSKFKDADAEQKK